MEFTLLLFWQAPRWSVNWSHFEKTNNKSPRFISFGSEVKHPLVVYPSWIWAGSSEHPAAFWCFEADLFITVSPSTFISQIEWGLTLCTDMTLYFLRVVFQCTCLAVSRKWLSLGTSAGGLHLIQREGWKQRLILTHKVVCDTILRDTSPGIAAHHKFIKVIPDYLIWPTCQEGSIAQVSCCPHDEDFIAVATR